MIELLGNHLWQSTLCAAAAGLLTLTLKRHRAHVRYWLWLAASVKFLVPFAALVAIGNQFAWSSSPVAPRQMAIAIHTVYQPFAAPPLRVGVGVATDSAVARMPAFAPVALLAPAMLIAVWLVGSVALLVVWSVRWRRVAAAVRRGSPVEDGRELRTLRRLEQAGGVTRPLAVVSMDARLEPGVFGILRPVLLWPRRITERLGEEQVEAILAHELCHVRRRDNLSAAVQAIVEALFWFHPAVWWIGARLVVERERACDEEVVRLGSHPRVYAESILATCWFSVESSRVCVAGVTGSDLKARIEQILANRAVEPLNAWRRILLAAAGVATIAVPVTMGALRPPRLFAQPATVVVERRGFGQADVSGHADHRWLPHLNKVFGFELLPGAPRHPADDPPGAVAWSVAVDHPAGRMSFVGFTARGLIRYAYGLRDLPVVDGPGWIDSESIQLSAATTAEGTDDEFRAVLRKLFEDRIKLRAHHESRDFRIYALVPARSDGALGPNLHPSTSACLDAAALRAAAVSGAPVRQRPAHFCGAQNGLTGMTFERATITELAGELSRLGSMLDRKVVDRTGMAGLFDATIGLGFVPAAIVLTKYPASGVLLESLGVRSIFSALPEQLGLRLDDATAPSDVLVIDRAER